MSASGPYGERPFSEALLSAQVARLRESEAQYRSIFENAQEGIYQTTPDGGYLRVNPALARIYGYDSPDALIHELTDIAGQLYVDSDARERFKALMEGDGVVHDFEARIYRRDGAVIWITENARCVRGTDGEILYYEGTVEDITDRKRAEEEIRLLAKVFESVAEGIVLLDEQGLVQAVNPAFATLTGAGNGSLRGRPLRLAADGLHEKDFMARALDTVREHGRWSGEMMAARTDGSVFPAEVSITPVRAPDGTLTHLVVKVADVSRRKQDEEHIRFHAFFDTLTRLPNRRLVLDRLETALSNALEHGRRGCVLFLDLDRFKAINDTHGHAAGDELLRLVARRLRHCVRPTDTVGRLGGDEFIILLPDCGPGNIGTYVAEKVLYNMSEPFVLTGSEQFCIPSIGITYFPDDAHRVEDVLRCADAAMYNAKKGGERRYSVYAPHMGRRSVELVTLENDLRLAAARGELELHYQPKVDAATLKLVGAEALIRWRHPTHGMISPGTFIPLAEETGMILSIGRWVLRKAARQLGRWRARGLDLPSVSVNVSALQFTDPTFAATVQAVIAETGIDPSRLDLEITETAMSDDVERALHTLRTLKDMGVTLSIDDFGTGYSSLNYLKTLPIDTLKIDQTFVRDVVSQAKDAAIASTIITLAQNLGFSVVAEGVETEDQAVFLRDRGCHHLQGYWIARPLKVSDFTELLEGKPAA